MAGLLRFGWAYGLGWAIQVAAIALGFVIHAMFVLGAIFLALWATAYFLGSRIERERAEWAVTGEYPGRAPADPADHSHTSGRRRQFFGVSAAQARTSLRWHRSEDARYAFATPPCAART